MTTADAADGIWRALYAIQAVQHARTVAPLTASMTTADIDFLDGLDVAIDVLAQQGVKLADELRDTLARKPVGVHGEGPQ